MRILELFAADRQQCRIKYPHLSRDHCKAGEFWNYFLSAFNGAG